MTRGDAAGSVRERSSGLNDDARTRRLGLACVGVVICLIAAVALAMDPGGQRLGGASTTGTAKAVSTPWFGVSCLPQNGIGERTCFLVKPDANDVTIATDGAR